METCIGIEEIKEFKRKLYELIGLFPKCYSLIYAIEKDACILNTVSKELINDFCLITKNVIEFIEENNEKFAEINLFNDHGSTVKRFMISLIEIIYFKILKSLNISEKKKIAHANLYDYAFVTRRMSNIKVIDETVDDLKGFYGFKWQFTSKKLLKYFLKYYFDNSEKEFESIFSHLFTKKFFEKSDKQEKKIIEKIKRYCRFEPKKYQSTIKDKQEFLKDEILAIFNKK